MYAEMQKGAFPKSYRLQMGMKESWFSTWLNIQFQETKDEAFAG